MYDLEVRVAEARGAQLDEKLVILDLGDVNGDELIRLVVLPSC